jgi:N-acyl-L-homoserine lactone synthetase
MSKIDSSITNHDVIQCLDTEVFIGKETARFAVGMIAIGDEIIAGREKEYAAYLRLRAGVYVGQTNMLSAVDLDENGTDRDANDARSVHFAVIENGISSPRVVASMRLIIKSKEESGPLPIEEFFPEAFDEPAPLMSNEVSRYICRHEDQTTQNELKWPLYTAALTYIIGHQLTPTYGVVEEPLEKSLENNKVPVSRIADPKYLEEYAALNLGLKIDTDRLAQQMGLTIKAIESIKHNEGNYIYLGEREVEETEAA